ncbi:MAG TPA: response regulator transcription factor [Streptosporangiaceae bacterium]|nr:response regulator transcription factor [Streptosporangiaceae bacterium]
MVRLVLGDNHVVFLDALSTVLSQHGYGVGAVARNSAEMVALVRRERPDAVLIDRNSPADDDAHTIGRVLAACNGTSVIVLSANPSGEAVGRALDAGAVGYLHQSRGVGALVGALERVLHGETVVDVPEAASARRSAEPNQALRLAAHLTCRERECLMLLVEGLDTAAMVTRLGVSRTTVRTHLQAVLTKLGVHSRLEAASFAVRHRLPDLWSGEEVGQAVAPAARAASLHATRTSGAPAVAMASTVRQIRPRQPVDLSGLGMPVELPPLAVAAGQGGSAG